MNRKIWTILVSVALIGCFFLPFFKFGSTSAYDIVTSPASGDHAWEKYIWLVIPLSAVILLIGAMNNGTYFLGRSFWTLLPLLTVLYFLVRIYLNAKDISSHVAIKDIIRVFDTGYWATLGLSVLLAFIHPRK